MLTFYRVCHSQKNALWIINEKYPLGLVLRWSGHNPNIVSHPVTNMSPYLPVCSCCRDHMKTWNCLNLSLSFSYCFGDWALFLAAHMMKTIHHWTSSALPLLNIHTLSHTWALHVQPEGSFSHLTRSSFLQFNKKRLNAAVYPLPSVAVLVAGATVQENRQ